MGKGRIITHEGDGQYTVAILHDRAAVDAELTQLSVDIAEIQDLKSELDAKLAEAKTAHEDALAALNDAIATRDDDGNIDREVVTEKTVAAVTAEQAYRIAKIDVDECAGRLVDAQQRQAELQALPDEPEVTAWCADYSLELTGDVATAEVPGEPRIVLVRPGFEDDAQWMPERDGQLVHRAGMQPHQVFFNAAILPGWQKWKPTYRLGTINNIGGDTADVILDAETSSADGLSIDPPDGLAINDVPIHYMDCDAIAFEAGDRVLVQFAGQDLTNPVVIGFEADPRPCGISCHSYGFFGATINEILNLPTGEKITIDFSFNSVPGCWAAGGDPPKTDPRTQEQILADAASGRVWRPYVLLTGPASAINGKTPELGEGAWLYCDPSGTPWRMTLEQSDPTPQGTIIFSVWRRQPINIGETDIIDQEIASFEWEPELPSGYPGPWTADLLAQQIRANRWHSMFPNRNGSKLIVNVRSTSGIASSVAPYNHMQAQQMPGYTLLSALEVAIVGTGNLVNGSGITAIITQTHDINDLVTVAIDTLEDEVTVGPVASTHINWSITYDIQNEEADQYDYLEIVNRTSTLQFVGLKQMDRPPGQQTRELDRTSILLITPYGNLERRERQIDYRNYEFTPFGSLIITMPWRVNEAAGNRYFEEYSCDGATNIDTLYQSHFRELFYTGTIDIIFNGQSTRIVDLERRDTRMAYSKYGEAGQACYIYPSPAPESWEIVDLTVNGVNINSDVNVNQLNLMSGIEQDSKNTIQLHSSFPTFDMQARQADVWRIGIGEEGFEIIHQSRIQQPGRVVEAPAWVWPPPQSYEPVTGDVVTGDYGQIVQWV